MTDHPLPLPHRRGVREIAQAIIGSSAGALFVCVGRSTAVRAAVEDALRGSLGGRPVVAVTLADDDDVPWTTILEAAQGDVVVSLSFATEPPPPALLARVNVGREVGTARRVSLLVWIGLGSLRDLQRGIADVWAYRDTTVFFASCSDFEVDAASVVEATLMLTSRLAEADAVLSWATGHQRATALRERALFLGEMGRHEDALLALNEAEAVAPGDRLNPAYALTHAQVLRHLGDGPQLGAYLDELQAVAERSADYDIIHNVLRDQRLDDARAARRWEAAFHLLDAQRVAFSRYPWASNWFAAGIGPACVNLAEGMVSLGQLGAAEDLLREAEERIGGLRGTFPQKTWTRMVAAVAALHRGVAARARTATHEALAELHGSAHRLGEVGALDKALESMTIAAEIYAEIGLCGDARQVQGGIDARRREIETLTGGPPTPSREDVLAESSPHRRTERALVLGAIALDEGRSNDAAQHLADATRSHEEDEPRFRSHYLAARVARLQSRLALHRSRPTEALPPLAQSAATLEEAGLHRERLNTLFEIARLPPEAASLEARVRAARGAWRIARGGGLLVPERDALALRAQFAREVGALDEAAAHEAVIAEIDEALAAGRSDPAPADATLAPSP